MPRRGEIVGIREQNLAFWGQNFFAKFTMCKIQDMETNYRVPGTTLVTTIELNVHDNCHVLQSDLTMSSRFTA